MTASETLTETKVSIKPKIQKFLMGIVCSDPWFGLEFLLLFITPIEVAMTANEIGIRGEKVMIKETLQQPVDSFISIFR